MDELPDDLTCLRFILEVANAWGHCPQASVAAMGLYTDGDLLCQVNRAPSTIISCKHGGCNDEDGKGGSHIHAEDWLAYYCLKRSRIPQKVYVSHEPCTRCTVGLIAMNDFLQMVDIESPADKGLEEIIYIEQNRWGFSEKSRLFCNQAEIEVKSYPLEAVLKTPLVLLEGKS